MTQLIPNLQKTGQTRLSERIASRAQAYELFRDLGQALGVRDLRVAGEFGLMEGSIADEAVLMPYGQGHRWASYGLDYLCEFFCKTQRGTFVDAGAGIGLWTVAVAREEFVRCKAFESDPAQFRYLMGNVKTNCPNGNAEACLAGPMGLDAALDPAQLPSPIAVKINAPGHQDAAIRGAARLLAAADAAILTAWPKKQVQIALLDNCFRRAAIVADGIHDPKWRRPREIVPPDIGTFEIILEK